MPPANKGAASIYEAFNDLHNLAQAFAKPFDAPAILVVGHQTDGKSALVESLLGFQFNHVGGGTKTRRPLTLHMKYNAACHVPKCSLVEDNLMEVEMTLEELQERIEWENVALEREQRFSSKELVVKISYRLSPNLTVIDTPGLISAAPGKGNEQLQANSVEIEKMVRLKMAHPEAIILCLEDCNDWSNATTRRLVMQIDPSLARTVVVSTKLDTRIPTFSRAADVHAFLSPDCLSNMVGGAPFFTSVPAGRVGSTPDCRYATNEDFRAAVLQREASDVAQIEVKMGGRLDQVARSRMGVSALRRFLEGLLKQRYLEYVPTVLPLIEKECHATKTRLNAVQDELAGLNHDQLKERGRLFTESFLNKVSALLKGNAVAPPDKFGENLADERLNGGSFSGLDGSALHAPHTPIPNETMRLFGGAAYHRALTEFRMTVSQLVCPDLTREEVANSVGLDDMSDGPNIMRAACIIAVAKARETFEQFIHQLGARLNHVMSRMLPPAVYLLQRDSNLPVALSSNSSLLQSVGSDFSDFLDEVEASCKARCLEDLQSTTRFVTWSLHTKNALTLKGMLGKIGQDERVPASNSTPTKGGGGKSAEVGHEHRGALGMAEALEHTLFNRQLNSTNEELVSVLVAQIFEGVRDHLVQNAELKFNCFYLMPLVDAFPLRLRSRMEGLYQHSLDALFSTSATRSAIELSRNALANEVQQLKRLQKKFVEIHATVSQQQAASTMASLAAAAMEVQSEACNANNSHLDPYHPSALSSLNTHIIHPAEAEAGRPSDQGKSTSTGSSHRPPPSPQPTSKAHTSQELDISPYSAAAPMQVACYTRHHHDHNDSAADGGQHDSSSSHSTKDTSSRDTTAKKDAGTKAMLSSNKQDVAVPKDRDSASAATAPSKSWPLGYQGTPAMSSTSKAVPSAINTPTTVPWTTPTKGGAVAAAHAALAAAAGGNR